MNREEAAGVLSVMRYKLGYVGLIANEEERTAALGVAISYLLADDNNVLNKQPDPITGLVPCGCGAIAKVRKSQAPYSGYYIVCQNINCICNVGFDRDTSGVPLGYFKTEEEAIKAWNTAMGYTAPPRPGAIEPDVGEMAPNGDEGAES